MEFKDYYQILGIEADADAATIKAAYRKLARQYHPDVSKEPNAEEKFKEIGEAYDVLKDTEKRASYDQLRHSGYRPGESFTPPPGFGGFNQADFGDINNLSDLFSGLFTGGFTHTHAQQAGEDTIYRLPIQLEEAYSGCEKTIQGMKVRIPAGIKEGQKVRVKGKGQPGFRGPAGDLYLQIEFLPHPWFDVDRANILHTLNISPWEAALGAQITVPTLSGKLKLKIPPNSQSGNKLRLPKKGLPAKPQGDQIITLQIQTPPANTTKAKTHYEKMAALFSEYNPRQ